MEFLRWWVIVSRFLAEWPLVLWIFITRSTVIGMLWFLSHVVEDLEIYVLDIFVEFVDVCVETGLSSQSWWFFEFLRSVWYSVIFLLIPRFGPAFFLGSSSTSWAPVGAPGAPILLFWPDFGPGQILYTCFRFYGEFCWIKMNLVLLEIDTL